MLFGVIGAYGDDKVRVARVNSAKAPWTEQPVSPVERGSPSEGPPAWDLPNHFQLQRVLGVLRVRIAFNSPYRIPRPLRPPTSASSAAATTAATARGEGHLVATHPVARAHTLLAVSHRPGPAWRQSPRCLQPRSSPSPTCHPPRLHRKDLQVNRPRRRSHMGTGTACPSIVRMAPRRPCTRRASPSTAKLSPMDPCRIRGTREASATTMARREDTQTSLRYIP